MLRKEYSKELEEMHNQILRVGSLVEAAIENTSKALESYDRKIADQVIENDDVIDEAVLTTTRACIVLILRQQPVAGDLRDIIANLKLITDLERMADHAEDICLQVRFMVANNMILPIPRDLMQMFVEAKQMTRLVLNSYVQQDRDKAMQVIKRDDVVDNLYQLTYSQLQQDMKDDTKNIPGYMDLVLIAKRVERLADHAENVAEWIIYYLDGAMDIFESQSGDDKNHLEKGQ